MRNYRMEFFMSKKRLSLLVLVLVTLAFSSILLAACSRPGTPSASTGNKGNTPGSGSGGNAPTGTEVCSSQSWGALMTDMSFGPSGRTTRIGRTAYTTAVSRSVALDAFPHRGAKRRHAIDLAELRRRLQAGNTAAPRERGIARGFVDFLLGRVAHRT